MFCPNCGNDAGNNNVCPHCGVNLGGINDQLRQNQQNQYAPQGQQNYYNQQPQYAPQNQYPQQGYGEQEQYGYQNQNPANNPQYPQYNQQPQNQGFAPQYPQQQGYAPQVPQKKKKKNIKLPVIIGSAAVVVIAAVVVLIVLFGGKKYFKASDYSEDADRVVDITEDAFNLVAEDMEENDGKNTDKIILQAIEALDNGFDKKDIDKMMNVITKSDIWEDVEDYIGKFMDEHDDFKVITEESYSWDDIKKEIGDDIEPIDFIQDECYNGFEEFDVDVVTDNIIELADEEGYELTEDEVREFVTACNSYIQKILDADIEELEYTIFSITDGDDNGITSMYLFVMKIDGNWVPLLPMYVLSELSEPNYIESSRDAVLSNAAESMMEFIKSEYATGNIRVENGDTLVVYAQGGELVFDFSGEIANYSDYLIENEGVTGGCSSKKTFTVTFTIENGYSLRCNMEMSE